MDDTETISELSCRICLVPCNSNDLDAVSVSADYKKCVGFEITDEDGALKLCQICMAELSLVKRFHDKCQTSELRLIKLRAENWNRLHERGNSSDHDEQLIPINYNPNEMDITVMPLQVSMQVGEQQPPVKRGRGRPKKIKPVPIVPSSDGSSSSNSWWKQSQGLKKETVTSSLVNTANKLKRRENSYMSDDPLLFPPPPLNDRVPSNPLQFLNSNDSKQNLIHKAAAVAAAAAVLNQQQHHSNNKSQQQKPVNNTVPFFCGICNRRFPFKNQLEVQSHMKIHYGAAADNPFTSQTNKNTTNNVAPSNAGTGGGVDPVVINDMRQMNPRMHHFVYPNKFTQHPKGYPQRIAK